MNLRLVSSLTALCLTIAAAPVSAREPPVPIEIYTGGDDALTQQLREAIEERLRSSGRFAPGPASSDPRVLKMFIPTHADWERVGNRIRVRYQLEFRRDGEAFGFFSGTCWENELQACARQALFATTAALGAD